MLGISVIGLERLRAPGAYAVAILFGLEALSRGVVATVLPLHTVELLGSDEALSASVFAGAVFSVALIMTAPMLARRIGRARMATLAAAMAVGAVALFIAAVPAGQVIGFMCRAGAVALLSVSFNLFIMEHIKRTELGRSEPLRMLAIGIGWAIGPILGVGLDAWFGRDAPYLASAAAMLTLIGFFWSLRVAPKVVSGDVETPKIVGAAETRKFANPARHFRDYVRQPRLVMAWFNAGGRSFFWLSFLIYTPVYAVQVGLGKTLGGALLSAGTAMMLLMPLWGWITRRFGIRRVAIITYAGAAVGTFGAWWFSDNPWLGAAGIMIATSFMAVNDGYGNALFFRACRPMQRDSMASVFTTYRDVSELAQALIFSALLSFLPIETVYLVLAIAMACLALASRNIHPRL